jgi:alpha-L-fucosidase
MMFAYAKSCAIASLLATLIFYAPPLYAQWSILEDDPRAETPGHLFQVFSKEEWHKSNFASEINLQWFRDAKYGMFVHFGLATYKNAELGWGVCRTRKLPDHGHGPYPESEWTKWADEFEIPEFDAEKLVEYAKDAGMKYIVVIAKHHNGFHMWDTKFSEFKITNTPFGRDFIKEAADACHMAKIKFGIYYSQRDWYHPDYCPVDPNKSIQKSELVWKPKPGETSTAGESHKKYLEYQYNVCRELCTKYGKVDVFWLDAAYWGGMFTTDMWDSEILTRMIRKLQPGIIINNRASIPGDFDTPEQRIGMFQNHRPWESCMCLCKSWSYSKTPIKTPKEIVKILTGTLCGDGNMLMSWGPQWSGAFHPDQIKALKQTGVWVKKNEKAIFETRGGPWKPEKWGGSVYRDNTVFLHVTSIPRDNKLTLSGLEQKVVKAAIHGGKDITFTQQDNRLELNIPKDQQEDLCTVVELSLDASVTGIIGSRHLSR